MKSESVEGHAHEKEEESAGRGRSKIEELALTQQQLLVLAYLKRKGDITTVELRAGILKEQSFEWSRSAFSKMMARLCGEKDDGMVLRYEDPEGGPALLSISPQGIELLKRALTRQKWGCEGLRQWIWEEEQKAARADRARRGDYSNSQHHPDYTKGQAENKFAGLQLTAEQETQGRDLSRAEQKTYAVDPRVLSEPSVIAASKEYVLDPTKVYQPAVIPAHGMGSAPIGDWGFPVGENQPAAFEAATEPVGPNGMEGKTIEEKKAHVANLLSGLGIAGITNGNGKAL